MLNLFKRLFKSLGSQRGEVDTSPAQTEPAKESEADPQTESVQDFFAEQLIDDNGNPVNIDGKPESKTDEPKDGKKEEGKKGEDKGKETGKEIPKIAGIEKNFFENDVFNTEKALDFFMPKGPSKLEFNYKSPQLIKKETAQAQPEKTVPPWQKEMEEEKTYRESLRTNLLSPLQYYLKARNELGMDEKEAFNFAQEKSLEGFNTHIAERDWENRTKREKELFEKNDSVARTAIIRQNARSNELSAIQELGSEENYRTLMFGYRDGKGNLVPGIGAKHLYKQFEIANSGIRKSDTETYSKKLSEWWDNFIGDPDDGLDNLQYVLSIVKGELQKKHFPEIVKKIRKTKETEIEGRAEGRTPKPAKAQVPAREEKDSDLERYFKGPVENSV